MSFGDRAHDDVQGGLIVGMPMILGLVVIAAIFYFIAGVVVAAFFGLLAAPVIQVLTKLLRWSHPAPFTEAFGAAFYGIIVFAVLTVGTVWALAVSAETGWFSWVPIAQDQLVPAASGDLTREHVILLGRAGLVVGLPGILACAAVLAWRIGEPYSGVVGYLKAAAVSAAAVVSAGLASYWLALGAADFVGRIANDEVALPSFATAMVTAIAIFLYSVLGALVAGLLLVLATRAFSWSSPTPYGKAYRTAFFGTVVYLAVIAVAVWIIQPSRVVLDYLLGIAASDAPIEYLSTNVAELLPFVRQMAWAQVPAILLGALVLASRIGAPYQGTLGYLKACVAGVFVFTLSSAATLFAATHLFLRWT